MPTPTKARTTRLLLLAALASTAGCFSLSRNAPPQRHYVLGSDRSPQTGAATAPAVADSGAQVIGLRRPRVADYLATPFIVVRRGAHQIELSEFHRWAEDLDQAINRSVSGFLAELAPTHRVVTAPWPGGTRPDVVIQTHVLRFEGAAPEDPASTAGEAHLLATWEVLRASDGSLLARGTTEVREESWVVGDFDGLMRHLEAGLARLAEDLLRASTSFGYGSEIRPMTDGHPTPFPVTFKLGEMSRLRGDSP